MEISRCLLFEKKMPKYFWAEAVNTAVYLINRLPTKALKSRTSFEAWNGFKPSMQHLKVFGCVCYVHVPAIKRDKLDKRAIAGIFLGYGTSVKGYKVFDATSNKIIISRDVKFDEDATWDWKDFDGGL